MRYYDIDEDEQKQLKAIETGIEAGTLKPVDDIAAVKRRAVQAAKNTLGKTRNINIRLSERDVYKLKAKAATEGLPYQTYAASILHKTVAR